MKQKRLRKAGIILLVLTIVITAIFIIPVLRHTAVVLVWGAIDKLEDSKAGKAVLPEGVAIIQDVPYIEDGIKEHMLDMYYPEAVSGQLPVIMFIHGGGFVSGDKKFVRQYCMTLADKGYIVFNVNYRLAPKYQSPAQIKDIIAALEWVEKNCSKYNGDPDAIVLAGNSAGAYLAGMAAVLCTNEGYAGELELEEPAVRNIDGVLLFSGVYDLKTGSRSGFPSIKSDIEMLLGTINILDSAYADKLSVLNGINEDFPPAFISSGEADWLHGESAELTKLINKMGIYHKSLLFDKSEKRAMHDYQFRLELDISKQCLEEAVEFLGHVTK
ncbi:MAG: alpha/beta hydrolase [Bacillota bacterium]